jgi:flagellar motility protein MotE (MotC chaperone)
MLGAALQWVGVPVLQDVRGYALAKLHPQVSKLAGVSQQAAATATETALRLQVAQLQAQLGKAQQTVQTLSAQTQQLQQKLGTLADAKMQAQREAAIVIGMDPQPAAAMLLKMPTTQAAWVIALLPQSQSAQVLAELDPTHAAQLLTQSAKLNASSGSPGS